jgi:hypothetical protein
MEAIETRGAHEYNRLELVATHTNGDVLAVVEAESWGARQCVPVDDK